MTGTAHPLTDNRKMQIIHELPYKVRREWDSLPREAKLEVLEGMDIGVDDRWVVSLIEEAKEMIR